MDRLDPLLHFTAARWDADALAAADRIDALPPHQRGTLAGVPFLQKTTPQLASPLVDRLVAAGAVSVGQSTRPGLGTLSQAWGWNGREYTRNPWDLQRSSGGSSAGAASAVAAGVVPIATGGDSAGSLRIPAAFCGVVGFKPSYGLIPGRGRPPRSGLTVPGVIGGSVGDVALATRVVAGADLDRVVPDRPLRAAYSDDLGVASTDPLVARVAKQRVAELAVADIIELAPIKVVLPDPEQSWTTLYEFGIGGTPNQCDLERANATRRLIDDVLETIFDQVDVLITPTTPQTATHYLEIDESLPAGDLCWAFNLSGHPAVTVPAGLLGGLPVGLQLVTAPGRDDFALAAAEQATLPVLRPPIHASVT